MLKFALLFMIIVTMVVMVGVMNDNNDREIALEKFIEDGYAVIVDGIEIDNPTLKPEQYSIIGHSDEKKEVYLHINDRNRATPIPVVIR